MKKTLAILIMLLPFVCGCREEVKPVKETGRFSLVRPSHDVYGKPCDTIRFNTQKEKDERVLEMEKVAAQWNRNLMLGRRSGLWEE